MYGIAGAMHTPGLTHLNGVTLDALDAATRERERIARQNRKQGKGKAGPKWYPGNKGAHKRRKQGVTDA